MSKSRPRSRLRRSRQQTSGQKATRAVRTVSYSGRSSWTSHSNCCPLCARTARPQGSSKCRDRTTASESRDFSRTRGRADPRWEATPDRRRTRRPTPADRCATAAPLDGPESRSPASSAGRTRSTLRPPPHPAEPPDSKDNHAPSCRIPVNASCVTPPSSALLSLKPRTKPIPGFNRRTRPDDCHLTVRRIRSPLHRATKCTTRRIWW